MKIAFGYKKRTGKDESVSYLINKYSGTKINFSKEIYEILEYVQRKCHLEIKKDRNFLQYIGMWGRTYDENIWAKSTIENMPQSGNIFCSDVRFKNEFFALKNAGFIMVKLIRYNEENCEHISEIELDSLPAEHWDYIIHNDSSLEDLYKKLDYIYLAGSR